MYARVATAHGPDALTSAAPTRDDALGMLILVDRRHERRLTVALFDGKSRERDVYDVNVLQVTRPSEARFARVTVHHGDRMRDVSPSPLMTLEGLAGTMMLIDRSTGRGLGFILFDSEEAMLRGDEVVTGTDPGTAGRATSVELYEVVELSLQ